MPLFDRSCSIIIGKTNSYNGLGIHGLRVKFNVTKTFKENKASVEVWNMSNESRSKAMKTGLSLIVRAGYNQLDGEADIYRGQVVMVNHQHSDADIITKIESEDGVDSMARSKVNLTYGPNTSAKSVLLDIIGKSPLPKNMKSTIETLVDKKLENGFQSAGPIRDALDKICSLLGTQWSIQDSKLKVIKAGGTDAAVAVLIKPESGLIGSPSRVIDAIKVKDGKDKPGWEVRSLLLPYVEPGSTVAITSDEIAAGSQFRVESVSHTCDTHGQDWYSDLVVVAK